ncbi:MAG: IS630 family transposase [Anaerolineales bacterium]|nr:IS630 family transposase [Anaerolineales bacterium]MCB0031131.1 IS630 family transposase [Anaerolineales bacterium]
MAEAQEAVDFLLHQSPRGHGSHCTRWRLQDVGRALGWLDGKSDAGIYKVLKRLGFSRKRALQFSRSPDPDYRLKWRQVLSAYQDAVNHPAQVVLLFADELTYFRRAELRSMWQKRGRKQRRLSQQPGANTKARVVAAVNAITGQLLYLQRRKIGRFELCRFLAQIRAAYPLAERLYLVQDNWPTHKHPLVLASACDLQLRLLFLPTYASWLNPIEKLWRWLRQDILHNHNLSDDFKRLRLLVEQWLDQFAQGSLHLLNYLGLLSKEELQNAC